MRRVGTVVRGIRTPIIKEDTDLATTVVDSVMKAKESEGFEFRDRDIIAITEAVVGISEGNYVSVDNIAEFVSNLYPDKEVGLVFPILSRNRFSMILKGIARGMNKITMLLSFPKDEVGNGIMNKEDLDKSPFGLNDLITEEDYQKYFKEYGSDSIEVISLGEKEYNNYLKKLNINYDDAKDKGILINKIKLEVTENKKLKKKIMDVYDTSNKSIKGYYYSRTDSKENNLEIPIVKYTDLKPLGFTNMSSNV